MFESLYSYTIFLKFSLFCFARLIFAVIIHTKNDKSIEKTADHSNSRNTVADRVETLPLKHNICLTNASES